MDSTRTTLEVSNEQNHLLTKESNYQDISLTFGWRHFRPAYLTFLTSPKWFIVIIVVYTLCAGISMNGLPVLILPSIEKRFSLSGKELGIISAANDVAALVLAVFIGFYGNYGNKMKWVAGGAGVSGPGVGILLGGQFLSVFVDIDQPSGLNLTPKDPRWIGAWWLGFLVFGLLFFLLAITLSGFPSSLPGAKERREKHIREGNLNKKSDSNEARLKEILPELKSLFMNWTFLFSTLGLSVAAIFFYSFVPFLGKIVQLKFGLDPVSNGYLLSTVLTPTIMVGIIFGALVVRQFPIKSVCKRSAFYVVVSQSFAIVVPFLMLLPGCLNVNMAGVSTSYTDRINSTHEQTIARYSTDVLISQCNVNCSCSIDNFTPVCGSDDIGYPNPCYAGCTARYNNKTFGSCSCIMTDTSKPGTARQGYCDRDCKNLATFLVFIGVGLCVFFSCSVPLNTVVLRCVPDDKRAFAMGMQYVLVKTIGALPGPIILGHLLDLNCRLWQDICGQKGRCFVYDVDLVSRNICIFGVVLEGISAMFFALSWLLYQPPETSDATPNRQTKKADGIETVL